MAAPDMTAILDMPALQPPPGVTPNFDNHENQNAMSLAILSICAAIPTICLALRLYGRLYLLRKFEVEETLIIIAFGLFWGCVYSAFALAEVPGYFVHQWDVRLREMITMSYWVLIYGSCYQAAMPLIKAAILIEWCRIFFVPQGKRTQSPFWWISVIIIVLQFLSSYSILIAWNLQCIPHKAIYDFTITDKKCFSQYPLSVASAAFQLATDIAIFLLPQPVIWRLKLSWKKKLGVSVLFSLGLIACISAGFRMAQSIAFGTTKDVTYALGPLAFWGTTEMACAFFVVCVPCIPKILKDKGIISGIKRRLGMSTTGKSSNKKSDGPTGNSSDYYGRGGSHPASRSGKIITNSSLANAYYQLDEESVAMRDLKESESTERLREEADKHNHNNKNGKGNYPVVTRTTRITVCEDPRLVGVATSTPPQGRGGVGQYDQVVPESWHHAK